MATIVTGEEYFRIDGQLLELTRQLRQHGGYPYDLKDLSSGLQDLIEGRFRKKKNTLITGQATWRAEGEHVIYFTLPASQGLTGPQWIDRLEVLGKRFSPNAERILRSSEFRPTKVGFVHRLIAYRTASWRKCMHPTTSVVQAFGLSKGFHESHLEALCSLYECFSGEELKKMGLSWLIGVHKTVKIDGGPHWFACSSGVDDWLLRGVPASPEEEWSNEGAFFWSLSQEN